MKKIFLLVAVVSAFSLASCKKDRVCTCTTTSDAPGASSSTNMVTYLKSTKGDARENCIGQKTTNGAYTTTITCKLK